MTWKAKWGFRCLGSAPPLAVLLLWGALASGTLTLPEPRRALLADTPALSAHPLHTAPPGYCQALGQLQAHLSWRGRPTRRPWEARNWNPGGSEGQGCVVQTVGGHSLCLVALSCGEAGLRGGAGRPLGSSVQGGHACPGPCTCPHQTGEALLRRSDPAGLQTLS